MQKRLVPFRDRQRLEEATGFARTTLYKWRTLRKYPQLFTKIGGAVFIDLTELEKLAEAGKGA